ncbi:MAG: VWA domain-containing protein [Candidatus Hermodarchaeota archaeon]
MVLFSENPVWFSLKFITTMRKHEKSIYKPSIRQAIAICKLILARFMNRGICEDKDFIEVAVITSPLENQALARRIATELLSFRDSSSNALSSKNLSPDIFGEMKPQDLVDDIGLDLGELDKIIDDFEFLNKFYDNLNDFNIEELLDNSLNDFLSRFSKDLDEEPYKTAMDFIDQNAIIDFNKFNDLNSLVNYAKELFEKKIDHLEPEDIKTAQKLNLLNQILANSNTLRERVMSQFLTPQNMNNAGSLNEKNFESLRSALEDAFNENFYKGLDVAEFALKTGLLGPNGEEIIKDVTKDFLKDENRNLNDIFNASKSLGANLNLEEKDLNKILENSLNLPFKDAYQNTRNIDQYFGNNMSEEYLNKILENKDTFLDNQNLEDVKEELLSNPLKVSSWRRLVSDVIDDEVQSINKDYEDQQLINSQVKAYIDKLIDNKENLQDFSAQSQLSNKISDLVNNLVENADNKQNLGKLVKDFNNQGFLPDIQSIKSAGERLNMPEEEILNLIQPNYKFLKKLVESNEGSYQSYKDFLNQMSLSPQQIDELVKLSLQGTGGEPNLAALSALSEKHLSQMLKTAEKLGPEALDMALSSLGAGSGLDLLEQWFYSRHNVSPNIKKKLKEIIKQIMIDLGIRSANSLIGTAKSGPLVENIVIPYTLGDDFELIDLEETINNLLEGGKTVDMVTNDDFLVSKTTDGLRCLVLELDISGSMKGQKLAQMALCATMLVYAFKPEEFALTFFESNTHKLKNLDENVELEKVVDELLDINARGGTCINSALKWANLQFEKKARSKYKLNILFTDADVFDFNNSMMELKKMKDKDIKFVMVVPKFNFSPVMANKMVKEANGVLLTLNQWRDFPKLISEIISNQ